MNQELIDRLGKMCPFQVAGQLGRHKSWIFTNVWQPNDKLVIGPVQEYDWSPGQYELACVYTVAPPGYEPYFEDHGWSLRREDYPTRWIPKMAVGLIKVRDCVEHNSRVFWDIGDYQAHEDLEE